MFVQNKWLGCLIFWGLISHVQASNTPFPRGCEARDVQFVNGQVVLNETGAQRFFLFYNRGTQPVEIRRPQRPADLLVSPSLSARLGVGAWAAFASDIPLLPFECLTRAGDRASRVSCASVVSVCEYPRAKFALSNMGNYWVSSNKSQHDIVTDAAKKGIYLHW